MKSILLLVVIGVFSLKESYVQLLEIREEELIPEQPEGLPNVSGDDDGVALTG